MDVFVFPSHYEGFGMAAVEAQVCGLRTIVSYAVPEEARVSTEMERVKLSDGVEKWAEIVAAKPDNKKILLDDICRKYNIIFQAEKWTNYYENILSGKLG